MRTERNSRRWVAVASIGLASLVVGAMGILAFQTATPRQPPAMAQPAPGDMAMRGLRSWIDAGDGRRMRVSAESVRLVRPRAFGPFRFGFARALEGRGVTVESFEGTHTRSAAQDPLAQQAQNLLSALAPAAAMRRVVSAEARDVTLIRHRADGTTATLTASACRSTTPPGVAVCRYGTIRDGMTTESFDEAACNGSGWTITRAAAAAR